MVFIFHLTAKLSVDIGALRAARHKDDIVIFWFSVSQTPNTFSPAVVFSGNETAGGGWLASWTQWWQL